MEPKKGSTVPILDTQAKAVSALGGMPATKTYAEISKVNSPSGRAKAPDSFRPGK